MNAELKKQPSYRREIYQRAVWESFVKLDPRVDQVLRKTPTLRVGKSHAGTRVVS